MNKMEKRILLIYETIMFILLIISLNDRFVAAFSQKITPIICLLMSAGAVVALIRNRDHK